MNYCNRVKQTDVIKIINFTMMKRGFTLIIFVLISTILFFKEPKLNYYLNENARLNNLTLPI